MANKVVLITGALTGIGRAAAIAFARQGASVVVSGRREEDGNRLADELRGLGAEAEFIKADVRHEEDVRNLVDKTVARFGHLDIAVNNTGTEGQPGLIVDQTPESLAATLPPSRPRPSPAGSSPANDGSCASRSPSPQCLPV